MAKSHGKPFHTGGAHVVYVPNGDVVRIDGGCVMPIGWASTTIIETHIDTTIDPAVVAERVHKTFVNWERGRMKTLRLRVWRLHVELAWRRPNQYVTRGVFTPPKS